MASTDYEVQKLVSSRSQIRATPTQSRLGGGRVIDTGEAGPKTTDDLMVLGLRFSLHYVATSMLPLS